MKEAQQFFCDTDEISSTSTTVILFTVQ